jgi:hypothetical protein
MIVYHGPRDQVIPFFTSLGFELPERKGAADFLQEITSRKDQKVCRALCSVQLSASLQPTCGATSTFLRGWLYSPG